MSGKQILPEISKALPDFELDWVEVPAVRDRQLRIRTLEDALDEFDAGGEESTSFLLRIRKKSDASAEA